MDDQPTTLWKLRRDGEFISCRVRLVAYGIEVDLTHNGTVILTRAFETGEEPHAWAQTKRAAREAQGWVPAPLDPSERPVNVV